MNTNQDNCLSYSIGFVRGDGDLEILATINNTGDNFNCHIGIIARAVKELIAAATDRDDILLLEREDAPDIVTLPDSETCRET